MFPNLSWKQITDAWNYAKSHFTPPPRLYSDIAKETTDIFNKDYERGTSFCFSTSDTTEQQMVFTLESKGKTENGLIQCSPLVTDIERKQWCCTSTVTGLTIPMTSATCLELHPRGLKTVLFATSGEDDWKVEFQNRMWWFGVKTGIGLSLRPKVDLSVTCGGENSFVGLDLTFDSSRLTLTKKDIGGYLKFGNSRSSLTLTDGFDTLTGSCRLCLEDGCHSDLGYQLSYKISTRSATLTLGGESRLPFGTFRGWFDSSYRVGAQYQYEWEKDKRIFLFTTRFTTRLDDCRRCAVMGASVRILPSKN